MLKFLAGLGAGTVAWMALSFALASRKDRKAREQMRRLADMQAAIFDVQDAANLNWYYPTTEPTVLESRLKEMRALKAARDRAAAAYFAAMGGGIDEVGCDA